jgi:hypothetical protein
VAPDPATNIPGHTGISITNYKAEGVDLQFNVISGAAACLRR